MSGIKNSRKQVEQLVLLALLTAVVAVLAYFGGFIKIGGLASISLTLIPVVIGSALCGPWAGAWLGAWQERCSSLQPMQRSGLA